MDRFWDFCTDVLLQIVNLTGYLIQNSPWVFAVIVIFTFGQWCFLMTAFFWMVVRLFRGYPPKNREMVALKNPDERRKGVS